MTDSNDHDVAEEPDFVDDPADPDGPADADEPDDAHEPDDSDVPKRSVAPNGFDEPVGPDAAELPDDVPSLDDLDPFEAPPEEFDDLAEFVTDEWAATTTARERVRVVGQRLTEASSASTVAELARVSEPTAREQLNTLVDEHVVTAESSTGGTVYRRNPDWYRMQRIHDLAALPAATVEAVLRRIDREVAEYEETHGVESPEALALDSGGLDDEAWRDVSEWRTALVDRQYCRTALQFQQLRSVEGSNSAFDFDSTAFDRDEYSTVEP